MLKFLIRRHKIKKIEAGLAKGKDFYTCLAMSAGVWSEYSWYTKNLDEFSQEVFPDNRHSSVPFHVAWQLDDKRPNRRQLLATRKMFIRWLKARYWYLK